MPIREDLALPGDEFSDLITGYRYCATLQLRTPAFVLKRHGEFAPKSKDGPPVVSSEQWHGVWVPELDSRFDVLSEGATMASDVGSIPRDGGDYLPFLLAVREISESAASVDEKVVALRALTQQTGPRGTPYKSYQDADTLLSTVVPQALTQLPVPQHMTAAFLAAGYRTLGDVDRATDAELCAIPRIGKGSVKKIRAFLADTQCDRTADRCVAEAYCAPR